MKKMLKASIFILMAWIILSCNNDNKIELFNGNDLENWTFFVSSPEAGPGDLFRVEDGIIHTSGVPKGYIRTKGSYSNYKLHLEWRWPGEPTNSGVLIHVQGEDKLWPHGIECQLKHEHAGDLVLIGKGAGITIGDSTYLITSEEKRYVILDKFEPSSEHAPGAWNSYDITSLDGDLKVVVNGVLQHSGTNMTPTEGNILLQSEGSPIQFRNIYLQPL